jgi:hypothetical protein
MIARGIPAKTPKYNRAAVNLSFCMFAINSVTRAFERVRLLAVLVVLLISFDQRADW